MISVVPKPQAPSIPPGTVRSSVEAGLRLGLEYFTAFTVVGLVFTTPAFILEMRGVGGFPKYAAEILGNAAVQICILSSTFQALAGRTPNVAETFWQIQRHNLMKLVMFSIVQALLVMLGFVLFAVPGLYLMTIWAVGMPALVLLEDMEFVDAFRQSALLTKGRRWRVFSVVVTCILMALLVFGLVFLMLRFVPIAIEQTELRTMVLWPVAAIVAAFLYPVSVVLYVQLRQEKEGLTVEEIVEPFY
jgi:hypothetical protein